MANMADERRVERTEYECPKCGRLVLREVITIREAAGHVLAELSEYRCEKGDHLPDGWEPGK